MSALRFFYSFKTAGYLNSADYKDSDFFRFQHYFLFNTIHIWILQPGLLTKAGLETCTRASIGKPCTACISLPLINTRIKASLKIFKNFFARKGRKKGGRSPPKGGRTAFENIERFRNDAP